MMVVEVGPAVVRAVDRCAPTDVRIADADLSTAVLAGLDDPYVLVGDRAHPTADVWAEIWDSLLGGSGCDDVELIVPSVWHPHRVDAVRLTLGQVEHVEVRRRWSVVVTSTRTRDRPAVVVEIGERLIGVTLAPGSATHPAPPTAALSRAGALDDVVARVCAEVTSANAGDVLLDCPDGIAGSHELGRRITDALKPIRELRVMTIEGDRLLAQSTGPSGAPLRPAPRTPGRKGRALIWSWAAVAAAASVVLIQAGTATAPGVEQHPIAVVVEGAVTVNVPALWPVERVTEGSGSARLQINSPSDRHAALHITQSRMPPGETLAAAAETLRRAVAAEKPGVFVDFNPDDVRVGRRAITYREVRDAYDIRWSVLLDGSVRISIGCQSGRGGESQISSACDEAVRSAHTT